MRDSGTAFAWDAFGITLLIWAPLFAVVLVFLRKRMLTPWRFRLAVSFVVALGLAPSILPIHASAFIVPAVTMFSVLEHMDSAAFTWAGMLGVLPIILTTLLVFGVWSGISAWRKT